MVAILDTDPSARDAVPPALAGPAETIAQLAELEFIPPEEIVHTADALFGDGTQDGGDAKVSPVLLHLVSAENTGVQTDVVLDTSPVPAGALDTDPADTESDQGDDAPEDTRGPDAAPGPPVPEGIEGDIFFEDGNEDPEFSPEDVAKAADLARRIEIDPDADPGPDPDLSERRGTSGAVRRAADRIDRSFEQAKATATQAEKDLGELMLSMIPGLGELMSAADAVKAFREAQRLEAQGKLDEALAKRGEAALNAVGAIPFVGKIAKVPKIAGKFKRFFRKADNAPKSRTARRIRSIDQLNGETTKAIDQLGMLRRQPQTAAAANLPFKKKNYDPLPYKRGTTAFVGRLPAKTKLFRVHTEANPGGRWILRAEDIRGLTPKQIQERFQIPDLPTQISEIGVPKGIPVKAGIVSPDRLGNGGNVVQIELQTRLDMKWVERTEDLQTWLRKNSK